MAIQVDVSANQRALVDSINRGVNSYNKRFAKSNSIDLKINERSFSQPLGRITGAVDDFGAAMAASNARVIAFGASTAVLGTAVAGFRSLAKATIEVEKNLTDVNRILQLNTETLQQFGKALFDISKRTATSFNEASKALLEFSRQGLGAEETLKRTNDALVLTRLAGLGAEASVAALTATVNGFSQSGITTTQVLNKLVAVEQAFAVSARDLSEGLARTGQAAQEAGVDIDQLNALISAAQQKTARGGAVIGNALKTIFTRLQRTDTLDQLERFDIAVRNVEGNILPATQILQNFANAYYNIADAQRAQLAEQVAGVYQVNILKALLNDLNSEQSIYTSALKVGSVATNEASVANAKLNQTLSALLNQLGTNTQQLASTIGSVTFEPLAKSATKAVSSIIESLTNIVTGEGLGSDIANGLLKGIRNVLSGPGAVAAFFAIFKLASSSFSYIVQALPQLVGITTETQKRQNLEQAILSILQQESQVQKALIGSTGNQKRQAEILLGVARQQTAEYVKQKSIAASLSGTLRAQGVTIGARGLQAGNPKTRSGGYIPPSARKAEKAGALAGGYTPGAVVNSPVGGVMNTAENVKYIPGFAQPFINPPKQSRAGRLHKINALRQVGVDPYQYGGFIPNFAKSQKAVNFQRGRSFEQVVGNMIGVAPKYNAPIDYERVNRVPRGNGFNRGMYKPGAYADAHVGLGHNGAQIISKILNHHANDKRGLDIFEQDGKILLGSNFVEIIGKGADIRGQIKTSKYSSLNTTAKNNYSEYEGQTFRTAFDKDKVNIPNFAAAYRNVFTGELNNSAIARGLRSGALTPQQASAMGYRTSDSKISDRKAKRAATLGALNYQQIFVPWDVEGFRGGRSGGRLNIAQGTSYEKYVLVLIKCGNLKGTSSLGGAFSLPARPDVISSMALKGGSNSRIDAYSLRAGELYEMKSGDPGDTLAGLQNKFINAIEKNPSILNPKRKWKNFVFRTTAAKGRGASGGFIPNLAYKSEVMDLEEFISGQKAIYSNEPFPHVRNENQPTFASAIADHGGLKNALEDSYKNQKSAGLVYGGYVPNFAIQDTSFRKIGANTKITSTPSDLQNLLGVENLIPKQQKSILIKQLNALTKSFSRGAINQKELNDLTEKLFSKLNLSVNTREKLNKSMNKNIAAIDKDTVQTNRAARGKLPPDLPNKKTRSGRKINSEDSSSKMNSGSLGLALAFAGPMIAGALEQAAFGSMSRLDMTTGQRFGQSVLSSGVTAATTGASVGAAFGPAGAAIGGLVGATIGLTKAFFDMELSTEELIESFQRTATKQIESANSYKDALTNFEKALESGDVKGQNESREKLAAVLAGITDKNFLSQLSETTDPNTIDSIIAKTREGSSRAVSLAQVTEAGVPSGRGEETLINSIFIRLGEGLINFADGATTVFLKFKDAVILGFNDMRSVISSIFDSSIKYLATAFDAGLGVMVEGTKLAFDDIKKFLNEFNIGGVGFSFDTMSDSDRNASLLKFGQNFGTLDAGFKSASKEVEKSVQNFRTRNEKVLRDIGSVLSLQTFGFSGAALRAVRIAQGARSAEELSQEEIAARGSAILSSEGGKGASDLLIKLGRASSFKGTSIAEGLQPISGNEMDVFAKIQDISNEAILSERQEMIGELVDYLEKTQDFSEAEIKSIKNLVSKASGTADVSGQEFLFNLESIVDFLEKGNKDGAKAASGILDNVANFTKIRETLQKNIQEFIDSNSRNEIILAGGIKRQRLALDEMIAQTVDFGRPFQAARQRRERAEVDINENLNIADRNQVQELRKLTAGDSFLKNIVPGQLESFVDLSKSFEDDNLSAQERIDSLRLFVQEEKNILPAKRQSLELQINAAELSLKSAQIESDQRRQTADYVLSQEIRRAEQQRNMGYQLQRGVSNLNDQANLILGQLAFDAPAKFADGMANALSQVAQGTKSIGDAFTDMAIDFGRMLQQEVFRALARKAVFGLFGNLSAGIPMGGSQKGGIIKAQNGMYISGGRTGDRNLAMLEDGEYVLNRNAVRMMGGPKSLDNLNFAMAPRFNRGGGFSMGVGLDSNRNFDDTLLINDANTGKIDSSMFSAFAYQNSPYFQDVRQRAEKRMQRRIQKRFERQQKRAQLVSSIVGMAGSMFMGAGISRMGTPTITNTGGAFGAGQAKSGFKGLYSKGLNPFKRVTSDNLPATIMLPSNMAQKGGLIGYNSGGFIPHGSRLNDTIPAMLTGGEYVMNNKAVKKYGLGTMNSMNFGSYQGGGTANSNTTNNRTNNNSTNVSVNIDRSGNAVYGSDTTSYEQQDIVISKKMAREISGIVLKNISNEKRYGGELHGK